MSIDRVATNNQTSYMLSQIAKANVKMQQSEAQVSTGIQRSRSSPGSIARKDGGSTPHTST